MWNFAHALLRRSPVALIGIDMGYPEGTHFETTPYFSNYARIAERSGPERSDLACSQYVKIYNPCFKKYAYMDKVFGYYRKVWLNSAKKVPPYIQTINCSEEGTLFGHGIVCMTFADFLKEVES
jgi:hypothetical protein